MKLTLHEIAKVVGAKNDVTAYEDVALNQIEFDSRKVPQRASSFCRSKVRVMGMILSKQPLTTVL